MRLKASRCRFHFTSHQTANVRRQRVVVNDGNEYGTFGSPSIIHIGGSRNEGSTRRGTVLILLPVNAS